MEHRPHRPAAGRLIAEPARNQDSVRSPMAKGETWFDIAKQQALRRPRRGRASSGWSSRPRNRGVAGTASSAPVGNGSPPSAGSEALPQHRQRFTLAGLGGTAIPGNPR